MRTRAASTTVLCGVILVALAAARPAPASHARGERVPHAFAWQTRPELHVRDAGGEHAVHLDFGRGFAAVRDTSLESLGWMVQPSQFGARLQGPGGSRVAVRAGTPFFRWNDDVLQLTDAPYRDGDDLYVPLQLLSDFLPARLPDSYAFDGTTLTLRWLTAPAVPAPPTVAAVPAAAIPATSAPRPVMLLPDDGTRVVIIDPGHGGVDPGTIGRGSVREKTVALDIARDLAADLEKVPGLEVHLTRDSDTLVALWDRGPIATRLKGDRPGVLISIHANSVPSGTSPRGFETYFLSEARTEHERRVAAIENAPLGVDTAGGPANGDLDFILRDMKNLDTPHWSSLLAQLVQDHLGEVHPGPDRGVRQAPLAVLTNALMPAVLVEVGYLSNPAEARLLARVSFQKETAGAIAQAVQDFFRRYPPGSGDAGRGRRQEP